MLESDFGLPMQRDEDSNCTCSVFGVRYIPTFIRLHSTLIIRLHSTLKHIRYMTSLGSRACSIVEVTRAPARPSKELGAIPEGASSETQEEVLT